MLLASIAEMLSIGAVVPFLAALMAPEKVAAHPMAAPLLAIFNPVTPQELVLPLTLAFGALSLIAGGLRVGLVWSSVRVSYSVGAELSLNIYRRTLYQPYPVHLARNSSTVIAGIVSKVSAVIHHIIAPVLTLMTAVVLLCSVTAVLLFVDWQITLLSVGCFGGMYALLIGLTASLKRRNGALMAAESSHVVKVLQEGLGGIREILLDGTQSVYTQAYQRADRALRRAQGANQIAALSPRYVIEALGMAFIAAIAWRLSDSPGGVAAGLPVIGALAIGAQRLLPVMQQAYAAWSSIQGGRTMFRDTLDLLSQPLPEHAGHPPPPPIPFESHVRLGNLAFRHGDDQPWIFDNLTLEIAKGSKVGIVGATGCGKSTLVDLISGLLAPTSGSICIDDVSLDPSNLRAWQVHVAHVPQTIFLADATVAENIAFGVPAENIDCARIRRAARLAQIEADIDALPLGFDTVVGERGVRLSGGQRQRLGIARALYKQADVIILDEATSALDSQTEAAVMDSIESLGAELTTFMIAHRLGTLKSCSQIIELSAGGVLKMTTYQELMGRQSVRGTSHAE